MLDVFLTYLRPLIVTNFEYYYPLYISRWAYINASIKKRIYRQPIPESAEIIKSTPEEDMEAHHILAGKMKDEYPYNLILANCHHWAIENKYIGMKGSN